MMRSVCHGVAKLLICTSLLLPGVAALAMLGGCGSLELDLPSSVGSSDFAPTDRVTNGSRSGATGGAETSAPSAAGTGTSAPPESTTTRSPGTRNACGGDAVLRFEGENATVLQPCGCGGTLVCNGIDALRCAREIPRNTCGGCGALAGEPDTPCNACGGVWRCGPLGDVVCSSFVPPNGCGGCAILDGAPGQHCADVGDTGSSAASGTRWDSDEGTEPPGTGEPGTEEPSSEGGEESHSPDERAPIWICSGRDDLLCIVPPHEDSNACGGRGALTYRGSAALPGERCVDDARLCGAGVLECTTGGSGLACVGRQRNALGECGLILGEPGTPCGCGGLWVADVSRPGGARCEGGAPNVCGGCADLEVQPGEDCGGNSVAACIRVDETACRPTGPETRACGGTSPPEGTPGTSCGTCESGRWECQGANRAACVGDGGLAIRNPCDNSCDPPQGGFLGGACGACNAGTFVCAPSGPDVICEEAPEDDFRNRCGGCSQLAGNPGEPCGTNALWACTDGGERVRCVD